MKRITRLIALAMLAPLFLLAQESADSPEETKDIPAKKYFTKRITSPPDIDGKLDDPAWNTVEWGTEFTQYQPDDGGKPAAETAFKILYDSENIYVGYRCFDDDPSKIVSRMSRRDGFEGDWVEINIDSYNDKRTAFSFTSSVSGVKGDEYITNNGNNWDSNWNPIWYLKTNIDEKGWTAEIRIPLSQLRYGNRENHIWGLQVTRRNFRNDSRSTFQYIPNTSGVWVSAFAELHGIKGIKPQKQIEIQPYGLARASTFEKQEGNPFKDGSSSKFTGGLDGKIGVTGDLVLDFTINPDFGQVEADPSVVRLDGFQNFFNEQRPFFIENNNLFDFGLTGSAAGGNYDADNLFYSRRIGASPHGYPSLADNEYADIPQNTSIIGAAKFSGKTQNGLGIGILESITAEEVAVIDHNGERREEVVEPLSNYLVGSLTQDFDGGNTVIGGIFTAVNRKLDGTGLEDQLHQSAYTGGLNVVQKWDNQRWVATGRVVFSRVEGTSSAIRNTQQSFEHYFQRPDADHLEVDENATAMTGTAGTAKIAKFGGNWKFETGATWRSPGLELNDIGFMNNADEINHFFWSGYRFNKPFSIFRNLGINVNHWMRWDFGGNHLYQAANTNFFTTFKNFYGVFIGYNHEFKDISNQALFGGPALRKSKGDAVFFNIWSDRRKQLSFRVNGFFAKGHDEDEPETVNARSVGVGVTYQPFNALRISVQPNINIFDRLMQNVTNTSFNGEDRYIVSSLDQNTLSMTIRLNYNITPNLTLQYYGQPFISRVRYFDYKRITDPQAKLFYDRFVSLEQEFTYDDLSETFNVDENQDGTIDYSFGNPDFSFIQFRSNMVARWEYTPGSELFLVWTQSNTNFGDPAEGVLPSLTDNLFNNKGTNIFLIKWTYRFLL